MKKRILVADDSVTIQKVIALTFAEEPFEIKSVGTGSEAVERMRDWRPDLVLADVIMPQMNGYELCRSIKSQPANANIPVILLAGTFEAFDEEEARACGADGSITKPFESGELIEKVKTQMARAEGKPVAAAPAFAPAGATAVRPAVRPAPVAPPPAFVPPPAPPAFTPPPKAPPVFVPPPRHLLPLSRLPRGGPRGRASPTSGTSSATCRTGRPRRKARLQGPGSPPPRPSPHCRGGTSWISAAWRWWGSASLPLSPTSSLPQ
jgi:CheY-like chemotaxis protein